MTRRPIRRALLSVSDKTGLVELGRGLVAHGAELVSTGGTAAALQEAGLPVTDIARVTAFPEILDGRVKTLHPAVHAGLLARRDRPEHLATLAEHGIAEIDLLVSNLYPFERALARAPELPALLEEIDIGGPAMTRAAAKCLEWVTVVVDPDDYPLLLSEVRSAGGTELALRRRLAAKAFARTAAYDVAIAAWLAGVTGEPFPPWLAVGGRRLQSLRYGENPHQAAAFYATAGEAGGLAAARQLQGKELSYNNIADADAALALAAELDAPAAVIVKHANPCGCAIGRDLREAYGKALASDPVSAFGGIVALNRPLDAATARDITRIFTEVVLAPGVEEEAAAAFAAKPGLRLLRLERLPGSAPDALEARSVAGGLLVQQRDAGGFPQGMPKSVTERAPTAAEHADLLFAWTVVRHVKSNAIVLARDGATVGIGMGQTSRVDAARQAVERMRAGPGGGPCVVASDAYFPFADGLEVALAAGATAAIQPGGSVRDEEVIAAANRAGAAMMVTGRRHFRH